MSGEAANHAHPGGMAADTTDALARLASHYGIVRDYLDVWGKVHPTSPATLRALLAVMGCHVPDDSAAQAALAAFEAARRFRGPAAGHRMEAGLGARGARATPPGWRRACA